MTIQTTRWRPDTCACVIDFQWDDTTPDIGRVHTASYIEACDPHPASGDLQADMAVVIAHNRAVNAAGE